MSDSSWMDRAGCLGEEPQRAVPENKAIATQFIAQNCAHCPVTEQCADARTRFGDTTQGVWGGVWHTGGTHRARIGATLLTDPHLPREPGVMECGHLETRLRTYRLSAGRQRLKQTMCLDCHNERRRKSRAA